MPHLPYSIELHDSTLEGVAATHDAFILLLRPAYIHNLGKGWWQDADLHIKGCDSLPPTLPSSTRIADGTLKTAKGPYHNLLNLPLQDDGPVSLELELVSGEVIHLLGNGASITLHGQATFLENL